MSTISTRTGAFGLLLLLAGCVKDAPPPRYIPTAEPFCQAMHTVCVSKDDQLTEGTASQVEANNLGRQSLIKKKVCRPRETDECQKPKAPTS